MSAACMCAQGISRAIPSRACIAAPRIGAAAPVVRSIRRMSSTTATTQPTPSALSSDASCAPRSASMPLAPSLDALRWVGRFTEDLPPDTSEERRVRQVYGAGFTWVSPTPTSSDAGPRLLASSPAVARMLGLDPASLGLTETVEVLAGSRVPPGVRPYAQCYGGHQFGSWAGQLGDGRAISLGEVEGQEACEDDGACRTGEGKSLFTYEIQLKGAGQTPYSRFADGRAILFSSLREFVASEAMAALGVPTTRALSLVATGDQVLRDRMYDGNPRMEPGAVVARVARSFVRIGSFELPASRGGGESELVKAFADHVIGRHYPHLLAGQGKTTIAQGKDLADGLEAAGNAYEGLVLEVARRTGKLAAEWERVGFVHGVLNTDNMSIVGETIDYGPYGFLERFDPRFTPNVTDMPGRRYCFANQPEICAWNVHMLGAALHEVDLCSVGAAQAAVDEYMKTFMDARSDSFSRKLGLVAWDMELLVAFQQLMYHDKADHTNAWRALCYVSTRAGEQDALPDALAKVLGPLNQDRKSAWQDWIAKYRAALAAQDLSEESRMAQQRAANPSIVPRNAELKRVSDEAEKGNAEPLRRYLEALLRPYDDPAPGDELSWRMPGPSSPRMGIECLSCAS